MKKADLRRKEDRSPPKRFNRTNLKERSQESRANILDIAKGDFRSALTNPIVIIVLLGIIILPSLYALINIYACWDPYENTANVEFAIANEDLGSEYNGERVDVGAKLIESLKENHDFKWVYVSSDELRRGVHNGTYYAGMIIPQNFSENVVSITTGNPHSAELEYIVNQKTSPVGAKLTDAASKAVYNKLNAEIVSFIDVTALGKLGELQEGLATGADKMEDGADQLSAGADKVASGADQLTAGANKVSSGSDQLASGSNQLATGARTLSSGANALSVGSVELANGADQVASGAGKVADGTQQIATKSNEAYDIYSRLKEAIINGANTSKLADDIDKLDKDTSDINNQLKQLYNNSSDLTNSALNLYTQAYNLSSDSANLAIGSNNLTRRTNSVVNQFDNVSNDISRLNQAIKNGEDPTKIKELLDKIDKEITDAHNNINELNNGAHLVANGSGTVAAGANQLADGSNQLAQGSNQLASGASELSSGASELSSGVHVLANGTIELASGAELLGYSSASALRNASNEIGFAADELSAVTDINQDEAGEYFFSPVILKRHEEFPTNNYGSQVSPFYIVLSMWVGALITCVMFKTGTSIGTPYKPHEMYLGKLVMFNIMSILETTVTILGVFLLGLDVANPLMFIFSCYFVAMVFMIIMYSLISLFGDVGKAIGILLLVFQISGSGGIYPVEIMSVIFRVIYPYLPMTHGINIVRESQLGLIWTNYMPSFMFLFFLGAIVIILSILLKQRWDKRTKFFDEKLEEADIFN